MFGKDKMWEYIHLFVNAHSKSELCLVLLLTTCWLNCIETVQFIAIFMYNLCNHCILKLSLNLITMPSCCEFVTEVDVFQVAFCLSELWVLVLPLGSIMALLDHYPAPIKVLFPHFVLRISQKLKFWLFWCGNKVIKNEKSRNRVARVFFFYCGRTTSWKVARLI